MAQAGIEVVWVIVERTGQYHLPVQRAFAHAGFETRILHPYATKQYRQIADPGNKTDDTDLVAQHRAAVAGFGLIELPLDDDYRHLRLLARHFRAQADLQRCGGADERAIRVRVAKKFTRLSFTVLAGRQVLRHACCQPGDAILLKLSEFHRLHHTPAAQILTDLQAAVDQLPQKAYTQEARSLSTKLETAAGRRRGPTPLGDLLPLVLARLSSTLRLRPEGTKHPISEPSEAQASH